MSGSVTVTGPPRSIWDEKIGTTEPAEPRTLPNRTTEKRGPSPVVCSDWISDSASRLVAPITLVGSTALSVEISTIWAARQAFEASATFQVPIRLVSTPSQGGAPTTGTALTGARWNT